MSLTPNENIFTPKVQHQNKSKQGITIEDARQLETFKDWNEEQLEELVSTLKSFCNISYQIWSKEQQKCNPIRAA